MSITVEFRSKAAADQYRDDYEAYLCPVDDDDRRLKTVAFVSDTPEWLLDQARLDGKEGRAERAASTGQAGLTDGERDRINFSKGRANVPHARAVKSITADHGVDDWIAYYYPTLTVDEHRGVMEQAQEEGGGQRLDANEGRQAARTRDATRAQQSSECDHAADHYEHGDPEACEFLKDACRYDEDDAGDGEEIIGKAARALERAWGEYKGSITRLDREIEDIVESKRKAEGAAVAINAIRRDHGQEPIDRHANRRRTPALETGKGHSTRRIG